MSKKLYPFIFLFCFFSFHDKLLAQHPMPAAALKEINEYQQNLKQAQQKGDLNDESRWLNKIGFLYWQHQVLDKAIETFKRSIEKNERLGNLNGVASIQQQIGMIYADLEDYQNSLNHFSQALKYRRKQANQQAVVSALINVSVAHTNLSEYQESVKYLEEALKIAQELKEIGLVRSCSAMLAENYEFLGNAEKSFHYFNLYASLEKKIQKEEIQQKEAETKQKIGEMQAVTDKAIAEKKEKEKALLLATQALQLTEALNSEKEARIEVLNKEKQLKDLVLKEKEARLKNESLIKNSFIGGFTLVGLLAVVLFMGYSMKEKANAKLSVQNTEILAQKEEISQKSKALEHAVSSLRRKSLKITQSITYAQRIQQAMLPGEDRLREFLPESFILFKPRDIVSGDFYWFSEAPVFQSGKNVRNLAISAIDCTGHGVPGAFMSMIGYNILEEIVSHGVQSSSQLLEDLHAKIFKALKQDESENSDGMDMALCLVNPETKTLEFSGAKNPFVYIKNGNLHAIKGDKKGIGGKNRRNGKGFTSHLVKWDEPITCYIFSDGYQDQFGGKRNRKFMSKQLRKLLHHIHDLPMDKQKQVLNQTIEDWRRAGNEQQVDDILIMGFRLDPEKGISW